MIMDYQTCFDSMWVEEVMNDLFEAGVQDDKLALLNEINKTNNIAIKTPDGITERKIIQKIIMQGDPWAPLECSV